VRFSSRKVVRKRLVAVVATGVLLGCVLACTFRPKEYSTAIRPFRTTPNIRDTCGVMWGDGTLKVYHLLVPHSSHEIVVHLSPEDLPAREFSELYVTALDAAQKSVFSFQSLGTYGWMIVCHLWLVRTALAIPLILCLAAA
jgi:hypothetical protein